MALPCNIQTSLDQNPCFLQLSEREQLVVMEVLLCTLNGAGSACDPAENYDECFSMYNETLQWAVMAALLCNIATGVKEDCDVEALVAESPCFTSQSNRSLQIIMAQLLCDIAANSPPVTV